MRWRWAVFAVIGALLTPATVASASPDASAPVLDLRSVIADATGVTPGSGSMDVVWRHILGQSGTGTAYEAVAAVVPYAPGTVPDTACARGHLPPYFVNNAGYCRGDRTLSYDETFLADLYASQGPFAPIAVLAHEWGHHLQALLGLDLRSIRRELQADCLAGIWFGIAESLGGRVRPAVVDSVAAAGGFYAAGDEEYGAVPWFDRGVHGSPWQRFTAFVTGYRAALTPGDLVGSSDVPAASVPALSRDLALPFCLGYAGFEPGQVAQIGPYELLVPPGRVVTPIDDGVMLTMASVLGYRIPAVTLAWHALDPGSSEAPDSQHLPFLERIVSRFGASVELVPGTQTDVSAYVGGHTAASSVYAIGSGEGARHGMLVTAIPYAGEGLLVVTVDDIGGIDDPDRLSDAEWVEVATRYANLVVVLTRLCGPGEDGVRGDRFDAACEATG